MHLTVTSDDFSLTDPSIPVNRSFHGHSGGYAPNWRR